MIDIKSIEDDFTEKISSLVLNKGYTEDVLPFELAKISGIYVSEIVASYLPSLLDFTIRPFRHDNILMISAFDLKENTIIDIMFTIKYEDEDKCFIVKKINCSVKSYLFLETV